MTGNSICWTVGKSAELYKIKEWGGDYFDMSDDGEVVIRVPCGNSVAQVKLNEVIESVRERGYDTPIQLRIDNIIEDRIRLINESFISAIADAGYENCYRGVFPIKVNQQAHVVQKISSFGAKYHHGLEAGSLPELLIAMALAKDSEALIVCNGYKDRDFVDMGLHALKMGITCIFVAESKGEIPLIVERSRLMGVKPIIGLRAKLSTRVKGHWEADSGDRSIFGLSILQMIEAVEILRREQMLDSLQLLHCHLGSQLPEIDNICQGVEEACRYYSELCKTGANLEYLDLGGGLAVDYDGSKSSNGYSKNYSVAEYAQGIVNATASVLNAEDIKHPVLITESGRATVAYSSILLFNILEVSDFRPGNKLFADSAADVSIATRLESLLGQIEVGNCGEAIEAVVDEAASLLARGRQDFLKGQLSINQLGFVQNTFNNILDKVSRSMQSHEAEAGFINALRQSRADIYYGNFSLFQSLPDNWALGQLFPIMPLSKLDQEPDRHAVLADITCDCDGKIDRFILSGGESNTIPLHSFEHGDDYLLGVFLVGAYQETLGSLHNLFGDNHVISIQIEPDSSYRITNEIVADDCDEVLRTVEFSPKDLKEQLRQKCESALYDGVISANERKRIIDDFSKCLRGYTYFER